MSTKTLALIFSALWSACLYAAPVETLTQTCAQCHGETGVSTKAKIPHLNGQLSDYLEEDIRRIANGTRASTVPDHIPKSWTGEEVMAVADFYAASLGPRPAQTTDAAQVTRGAVWYKKRCADCHPDSGRESKRDAPLMAAQNLEYMKEQTRAFVSGKRKFVFLMDDAFKGLSAADLDGVAHYFASQEQFKK